MTSQIFNALANGYTSNQVLGYLARRYPQYANTISKAQQANYPAHLVLKHLTDHKNQYSEDQFLTHEERTTRNIRKTNEQANLQTIGALGTIGAAAAGAYQFSKAGRAIHPTQILPPQRPQAGRGGSTINSRPQGPRPRGGLPQTSQQRGLPYNQQTPQQKPQQPNAPKPFIPKSMAPQQNVNLIKNINEETRVQNILKQGLPIATAISVLRSVMPKTKIAVLDKTEGGLEKVITDYSEYLQNNPPSTQEQQSQIQKQMQQEIQQQSQNPPIEQIKEQPRNEQPSPQHIPRQTQMNKIPVDQIIQKSAFSERPDLKKLVDSSYAGKQFSIPNYRYVGESSEDFDNRKIIFSAVDRAAKALMEGKSFLDFPITPEALKGVGGYSVAADVLRFMAGIPNIYNELLDPEEKQELFDALEPNQLTGESLRPSGGETNIHGAQMTPNLVWNLLLSVEPKLSTITRPPAIKGAPVRGAKMDTTGFRRFLTHGVYGVLSGKTVPPDLSEKIEKISKATNVLDVIVEAAKHGNFRKVLKEIERLQNDDEYLFSLISDEIDRFETSRISEDRKGASDTRMANQLKKMRQEKNIETEHI
jgi:hypothetical protein